MLTYSGYNCALNIHLSILLKCSKVIVLCTSPLQMNKFLVRIPSSLPVAIWKCKVMDNMKNSIQSFNQLWNFWKCIWNSTPTNLPPSVGFILVKSAIWFAYCAVHTSSLSRLLIKSTEKVYTTCYPYKNTTFHFVTGYTHWANILSDNETGRWMCEDTWISSGKILEGKADSAWFSYIHFSLITMFVENSVR